MLIREEERYNIIGAALEVHKILGAGFTEYVYQDALEVEFSKRGIPFEREKHIVVKYKGVDLKHDYYADFVCYGDIIVECKATDSLILQHEVQILNYLRATEFSVGMLINFGERSLKYQVKVN